MLGFFKKNKADSTIGLMTTVAAQKGSKSRFHKLRVADIRQETEDCVSVSFDVSDTTAFNFVPGQYLTFKQEINGEQLRRSYSICSSPLENELRIAVKRVPEGRFSSWATNDLKVNDVLEVMPPMGNFILEPTPAQEEEYIGFAAGSGITPLLSMIKTVLQHSPKSRFTLFYGNKKTASIIFKNELEDLKDKYLGRLDIHHVLSREDQGNDLLFGRIDEARAKSLIDKLPSSILPAGYFLCGPEEMIHNVSDAIKNSGADQKKIHFELFSSDQASSKLKEEKKESSSKQNLSSVTVVLDGEKTHFEQKPNDFVLDAALAAGADIPYACKGAVCCTCRAKVLEGDVEMSMNYSLTEEEVEEGYVLSCQSMPRSSNVVMSFDD